MLKRYGGNPIISPDPNQKWYPKKAYNCTAVMQGGRYYLLFRAVGEDWISRIMVAESTDGERFWVHPEPVIVPEHQWEKKGCEDPRITYIDGTYWLAYTAFDGVTARAAVASSQDLIHWKKHGLMFPDIVHEQRENLPSDWSKAAAIFPEKTHDHYSLLFGDNHIWSATSHNLTEWKTNTTPVLSPRDSYFDAAYIEMGPAPIRTNDGWLVLYHGINDLSDRRVYCLGAALLSFDNPQRILWRCSKPILRPTKLYETVGFIDLIPGGFETLKSIDDKQLAKLAAHGELAKAVFCCGALLENDRLRLYYGAADTRICTATIELADIFSS